MGVLNSWQRIDRVLSGRPFGSGADGAYSSSSAPTLTTQSCSGSADSNSLTISSGAFSNGDIVLIHQSRGTGVGQWEINRIASGGGTTTLTLVKNLHYTFTDSGASQAQVIKIPQYNNVTTSGTWSGANWNGNTGGILTFASRGTFTISGNINIKGNIAGYTTPLGAGYYGSDRSSGSGDYKGQQGEGASGARGTVSTSANGNGGGGGNTSSPNRGGGGGGNGAAGTTSGGTGGSADGSADLSDMVFGGGGGSGGGQNTSYGGAGGCGGGIMLIYANDIQTSGTTTLSGYAGDAASGDTFGGGGGGAGGSCLLVCKTATLGTNKFVSAGGTGGTGGEGNGGAGAVGRIAVHHSGTISGTTSPTFTDVSDSTLVEASGFFAIL